MNPRLRVLTLTADEYALVLDRYEYPNDLTLEHLQGAADQLGAVGFICFEKEVDIET